MGPQDFGIGALFWKIQDAVIVAEARSQRIILWNPAATKIFGYSTSEALELRIEALVPEHLKVQHRAGIARYAETGHGPYIDSHVPLELPAVRKSGEEIYVELSLGRIHPVDETGGSGDFVLAIVRELTGRKRMEEVQQRSLDALLTIHQAGQLFRSTLNEDEIGRNLLKMARHVSDLEAAAIRLEKGHMWHAVGEENFWHLAEESFWYLANGSSEARAAYREVLKTGEHVLFELQYTVPGRGRLVGLCVPLWGQKGIIGVLEAYGSEDLRERAAVELLGSLANQAASAIEYARLYGKLAEREQRLQELVGKLMVAHEEERRRVAYEVHDGLAQVAMGAHQHLQAFFHDYPPRSASARKSLGRAIELIQRTTVEARHLIADLRPSDLDDLGLAAAVRSQIDKLHAEGWEASYDETLGEERLPAEVETALYRVVQEALANVRKHAATDRVRVALARRDGAVRLEVRDEGRGFDPTETAGAGGPGERVGLSSMRERITLLGGDFEIRSQPGMGTSMIAKVPITVANAGDDGYASQESADTTADH